MLIEIRREGESKEKKQISIGRISIDVVLLLHLRNANLCFRMHIHRELKHNKILRHIDFYEIVTSREKQYNFTSSTSRRKHVQHQEFY